MKFTKEEYSTDLYKRDVFETYEEYCSRIQNYKPIKIGRVLKVIENTACYYSDANMLEYSIFEGLEVKIPQINAIYIKDYLKTSYIWAKLMVIDNVVTIDLNNLYVDEMLQHKAYAVILYKLENETKTDYCQRIENISTLPIGICYLQRQKYDLEKEVLPVENRFYTWCEEELKSYDIGLIRINRHEGKNICDNALYHIVYSSFKVMGDKTVAKYMYIFHDKVEKEFEIVLDGQALLLIMVIKNLNLC